MTKDFLSASRILEVDDLALVEEEVPEWPNADGSPGVIRLQQMDAAESIEMTKNMEARPNDGMFIILIHSAVNAERQKLFPLPSFDDPTYREVLSTHVEGLRKKSMKVLDRLQRVCLRINGRGPESQVLRKNA